MDGNNCVSKGEAFTKRGAVSLFILLYYSSYIFLIIYILLFLKIFFSFCIQPEGQDPHRLGAAAHLKEELNNLTI